MVETAFGSGSFAQNSPFTSAVLLDVLFAVLSVSGMTLAAGGSLNGNKLSRNESDSFVSEQKREALTSLCCSYRIFLTTRLLSGDSGWNYRKLEHRCAEDLRVHGG